MMELVYRVFSTLRGDRLLWKLGEDRLRILCYHGICEDLLADEPWMPSSFVTRSSFEHQLQYLRRYGVILPLADALGRLRDATLPAGACCLTFDDGYANNLHLALPLLEKYDVPASIFLATHYVETGDWYPFIKAKLIRLKFGPDVLPSYKRTPVDAFLEAAAPLWESIEPERTRAQRDSLRPLTVDEVRSCCASALVEFGAHSHTHCILRNETSERRRQEVTLSVSKVGEWTNRSVRSFCYPNGERGDFGEIDKAALRTAGIEVAVTGIGGANRLPIDPLELKRYPFTLQHDESRFQAEVTGLRTAMVTMRQGWGR
jgi:peptidoglycan/xylan/chitin deacetylase (PgdA/CDA1 family)